MNIPDEALTVARDRVLADAEWIDEETLRAALEAAAPLIVAHWFEAIADAIGKDTTDVADAAARLRAVATELRQETQQPYNPETDQDQEEMC